MTSTWSVIRMIGPFLVDESLMRNSVNFFQLGGYDYLECARKEEEEEEEGETRH